MEPIPFSDPISSETPSRSSLDQLAHSPADLPRFVQQSAVAMRYLHLPGLFDRTRFPERDLNTPQSARQGCITTLATSIGARIRHQLDRDSVIYKHVYKQRSATERINSQAKELGIERPRLRNGQAIANLNTLIYVLINLRALHRVRQKKLYLAEQ